MGATTIPHPDSRIVHTVASSVVAAAAVALSELSSGYRVT
jgi:hypothetical protein